jgi:hypothetical protein
MGSPRSSARNGTSNDWDVADGPIVLMPSVEGVTPATSMIGGVRSGTEYSAGESKHAAEKNVATKQTSQGRAGAMGGIVPRDVNRR